MTDKEGLSRLESKFKTTFNEKISNESMYKGEIHKVTEENEQLRNKNKKLK